MVRLRAFRETLALSWSVPWQWHLTWPRRWDRTATLRARGYALDRVAERAILNDVVQSLQALGDDVTEPLQLGSVAHGTRCGTERQH